MSLNPVVAAAIVDRLTHPTSLLAAQRAYPKELRGLYELPGGKVEPGEEPTAALAREIAEELGTSLTLGPPLAAPRKEGPDTALGTGFLEAGFAPWTVTGGRRMWVWFAEVKPGYPSPHISESHSRVDWVSLGDVRGLPWVPADLPIVEELLRFVRDLPTLDR